MNKSYELINDRLYTLQHLALDAIYRKSTFLKQSLNKNFIDPLKDIIYTDNTLIIKYNQR